jgi:hypothetical protein
MEPADSSAACAFQSQRQTIAPALWLYVPSQDFLLSELSLQKE